MRILKRFALALWKVLVLTLREHQRDGIIGQAKWRN